MEEQDDSKEIISQDEKLLEAKVRRKTFIAFSIFALGNMMAVGLWRWLRNQPAENGLYKPLRSVLELNRKVNHQYFSHDHLVPEYPKEKALLKPRLNGDLGLKSRMEEENWKLKVMNGAAGSPLLVSMEEIRAMPKTEIVFDFKCIEGWSQITHWGGVRFSDFANKYNLDTSKAYVGLETPDSKYYVGIDMPSALHPQTLLCYEVNGKPLPMMHGYPLRLIIPVKYGIKSLKRIGTIFFSDTRPHDYWFEQGYDYDAML